MRQVIRILILGILTIAVGCSKGAKTTTNPNEDAFKNFLDQFETRELPVRIKACRILSQESEFTRITADKYAPFIGEGNIELAYCKFKTNGDYIATISLGLADCLLPTLTTWTKDGTKIDKQTVAIGYCGAGPGYECEEFMTIDKKFSLYTSDSITSYDIDSLNQVVAGSMENFVIYRHGKLSSAGKIELSDTLKKYLRR